MITAEPIPRAISVNKWDACVMCSSVSLLCFLLAITHSYKRFVLLWNTFQGIQSLHAKP